MKITSKIISIFGVAVVLLSFGLSSTAWSVSMCSDVFAKKTIRGRLSQRAIGKINFETPHSETYMNEALASYYFYKKGDILNISDFSQNSLARRQLIFSRLLERQILTNGVKFIFQKEWQKNEPSAYRRFVMGWESFRHSLAWQALSALPLRLPGLKTPQQSDAILRDLVLNGHESVYWQEGQKIYDVTLRQEFYRKLTRVYTVIAYGFVMYVLEDGISDAIDKTEAEQNEKAKQDFMNALDALEQQVESMKSFQYTLGR